MANPRVALRSLVGGSAVLARNFESNCQILSLVAKKKSCRMLQVNILKHQKKHKQNINLPSSVAPYRLGLAGTLPTLKHTTTKAECALRGDSQVRLTQPLAGITHAAILDESMRVPDILSNGSMDMLPTW